MSSLWLKVMVAVPGTKAPQVVALRPTVTLEEAVISIIEKYHLQGCEGKQLSLPPKVCTPKIKNQQSKPQASDLLQKKKTIFTV